VSYFIKYGYDEVQEMKPSRNPWEILGVNHGASSEEIKRAFKRQALKHHPDKGGDAEFFKDLSRAYDLIKNQNHIPVLTKPSTKLVNVKLSIAQQIKGVMGIITTDAGFDMEVKIPPGARADDKFKVRHNNKNYIINIKELSHKHFTRQGFNVIMVLQVKLEDSLTGKTIGFVGPEDEDIEIQIPAGTANDTLIVLDNKGLLNRKNHRRGNLHIKIKVDIPPLKQIEEIEEFITRLKNNGNERR